MSLKKGILDKVGGGQGAGEERADRCHGFRSSAPAAAHRVFSVAGQRRPCKLRPGDIGRATLHSRALGQTLGSSSASVDKRDSRCGSRLSEFSVRDLQKCQIEEVDFRCCSYWFHTSKKGVKCTWGMQCMSACLNYLK